MALAPTPPTSLARSDVPLALWPCAQPDAQAPMPDAPRALLPAQLAARIIAEYTEPGALLVGPACPALLHHAARVGRRMVALTPDPASARQTSATLDLTLPAERRSLAQVRSGSHTDPKTIADLAGQAHALVTVNLDGRAHPASTLDPASFAAGAGTMLRPGGLLITISRNHQQTGRLVDMAASTIRAAERAGFAYLQHVVALLVPVQAGQLRPNATAWQRRTTRARLARGERVQLLIHADVLVFTAPEAADA